MSRHQLKTLQKQSVIKSYRFLKTGTEWHMDLPEYIERGGAAVDLQMVEGADKMLDMMAGTENTVVLSIAKEPFEGADVLILTAKDDTQKGGGYYIMKQYQGQEINLSMWLCKVTEFVLGEIPPKIFVRREKSSIVEGNRKPPTGL